MDIDNGRSMENTCKQQSQNQISETESNHASECAHKSSTKHHLNSEILMSNSKITW